jgi:H+/Cl- antiporter ClcA
LVARVDERWPHRHKWEVRASMTTTPSLWLARIGRSVFGGVLSGTVAGAGAALFLWLLDEATELRAQHEVIVYALPLAGLGLGLLWQRVGQPIRRGNDLVIDAIVQGGAPLPLRMAPLVLFGSVVTHLFGGSAGREGAAVQIGASLSDRLARRLGGGAVLRQQLVTAGAAGGFGAVFGTPLAGCIFGLEFVGLRRADKRALLPAAIAAFVGDFVTRRSGIHHSPYPRLESTPLTALLFAKWLAFALGVALVTLAFIEALHGVKALGQRFVPQAPWRLLLGGVCVVALWRLSGTSDYLGLGVPGILRAFSDPHLPLSALPWKMVLTIVTLGAGFLGGEVTPLFFIGATLGNLQARLLELPLPLGAGVGLAAVFGAAANAPIALSIMAVEIMGWAVLPHVAIVCGIAWLLTRRRSIYPAQLAR